MKSSNVFHRAGCLCLPIAVALAMAAPASAASSSDEVRNAHAKQGCTRGQFKDYYLQGEGGDPPADYTGRVFKLSQNYPDQLPPKEDYPWLAIDFKDGGPVDPRAYLDAMLKYGLEGNVEADFYVEDNKVRQWYGMPWMDWNTEVTNDWPGTDGREFVHGLTHEFDTGPGVLSSDQTEFVQTWAGAYFNDRAGFGIGQVYCDPNSPDPTALNPDPDGLNSFPDGAYIIKLLFTSADDAQLSIMKDSFVWQADAFVKVDPNYRNEGPISRYERTVQPLRLLQIDVAVRDDRSVTGWLLGTYSYDGRRPGDTAWDRLVPLGLAWGSNPELTYSEICDKNGVCDRQKLTEQWIDEEADKELTTAPLSVDHLGYAGRLAGPVDNPQSSCMACHQTAGFPAVAIEPEFSAVGANVLKLDDTKSVSDHQDFRMSYFRNVYAGVVFSDTQMASSDFSLQLSMSLNNFTAQRCAVNVADKPELCTTLGQWASAIRNYVQNVLTFGTPGPGGAPLDPAQ